MSYDTALSSNVHPGCPVLDSSVWLLGGEMESAGRTDQLAWSPLKLPLFVRGA